MSNGKLKRKLDSQTGDGKLKRKLDSQTGVVLVVGKTGIGKSTMVNALTGADIKTNTGLMSVSEKTLGFEVKKCSKKVVIFDTPGLGDSESRDQLFLNQLIETMQSAATGIHRVYYCSPVHNFRWDGFTQECIKLIMKLLGTPRAGVLTFVITMADRAGKSYWSSFLPEGRINELKEKLQKDLKIPVNVLVYGQDYPDEVRSDLEAIDLNNFSQTSFMEHVQTLTEEKKKLQEGILQAEEEKKKVVDDMEKAKANMKQLEEQIRKNKDDSAAREKQLARLQAERELQSQLWEKDQELREQQWSSKLKQQELETQLAHEQSNAKTDTQKEVAQVKDNQKDSRDDSCIIL